MNTNTPQGTPALQGTGTPPGMYWSAAESARRCGVSRATIDRAIKAGKLAAEKDADGAWRISPHALAEAGLNPGKPAPPDPAPALEDRDKGDELERLRLELAEVRAESRVLTVRLEAERRILETVGRERDLYRRMIEAPPQSAPIAPQTHAAPESTPIPAAEPVGPSQSNVGRFRRAWNVLRY